MISFKQYFLEKVVLGLEETIYIDGVGQLKAKLDTGNGAFNVLHGVDKKIDNDVVRFTTEHGVVLEKPIENFIEINMGAKFREERPVVKLNVKIGNMAFKKIPFTISDRSANMHKVLISKSFIQNELDAVIDVSLKDVAKKQITIDYE